MDRTEKIGETADGRRRHAMDMLLEPLYGGSFSWRDGTRELAVILDATRDDLVTTIGSGWTREPNLWVADESRIWYVSGDPMQVMLGVARSDLVVGTPTLYWRPAPVLALGKELARLPLALGSTLVEAVTRAQEIRRAAFTYCRSCRRFNTPESGGAHCHGCMQSVDGVVF